MVTMLGWLSAEAERASRSKRCKRSLSADNSAGRILIATVRSRRGSRARYTSPIPPAPSSVPISYGPRCEPGRRGIDCPRLYPHQRSRRPCESLGTKYESVPVNVLKRGRRAPLFALRLHDELHAFRFQFARRRLHVVLPESDVHLAAGLRTLAEFKEDHPRVRPRYAQLDPALLLAERLVCEQAKAEFFGVKRESAILIADGDTCELHAFDHGASTIR